MPTTIVQISQSCEGEPDLIALPAIAAKLHSLPEAGKEPQHLPFPVMLSLGMCFWEAETPGLQTKQG